MLPPKMDTGMAPGLVSGVRWADYTTGAGSLGGVSRGVNRRGNMGIVVEWKISDAATSGIPVGYRQRIPLLSVNARKPGNVKKSGAESQWAKELISCDERRRSTCQRIALRAALR